MTITPGLKLNGKFYSNKEIKNLAISEAKRAGLKPYKSVIGETNLEHASFIVGARRHLRSMRP